MGNLFVRTARLALLAALTGCASSSGAEAQAPAGQTRPASGSTHATGIAPARDTLATGGAQACVVRAGRVWCWGSNGRDELGDPRVGAAPRPVHGPALDEVVELAAGPTSTCARHQDGRVACWGEHSPAAHWLAGLDDAVELAVGSGRVCVRRDHGAARCWSLSDPNELPQDLPLQNVVALAGDCAVDDEGRQRCFEQVPPPRSAGGVRVPSVKMAGHAFEAKPRQIQAARRAARQHLAIPCVLRKDGTVGCWSNDHRLPRMGPQVDADGLMTVEGITKAEQIAAGREFVCAVLSGGSVACTTGPIDRGVPIQSAEGLEGIDDAVQIVAGQAHVCVRRKTGAVACWGANAVGQLGNGSFEPSQHTVEIPELRVVDLAAGDFHTCGRTAQGQLWCWGLGEQGQLGDRFTPRIERDFATEVPGLADVAEVVPFAGRTCAREQGGAVWCWGLGSALQGPAEPWCHPGPDGHVVCPPRGGGGTACGRALDSRLDGARPRQIDGIVARDLEARGSHLMVLDDEGQIFAVAEMVTCGERSDALRSDARLIAKVEGAVALAVGGTICARTSNGAVHCSATIEPGPDPGVDSLASIALHPVAGVDDATALVAGYRHACALRRTGIVTCWGEDPSGQLGDGVAGGASDPVDVVGLDKVTEITAGWFHTCARRADATVWCWGENDGGSLGDTTTDDRATPTRVPALGGVDTIDADQWETCAWHGRGQVSCWGVPPSTGRQGGTQGVRTVEPWANR